MEVERVREAWGLKATPYPFNKSLVSLIVHQEKASESAYQTSSHPEAGKMHHAPGRHSGGLLLASNSTSDQRIIPGYGLALSGFPSLKHLEGCMLSRKGKVLQCLFIFFTIISEMLDSCPV